MEKDYYIIGVEQTDESAELHKFNSTNKPIAIIMGNEVHGVNQDVIDICDEIDKRGLKVAWDYRGRVNGIDEESIIRFKNSGGRMISFGIETSSEEGVINFK